MSRTFVEPLFLCKILILTTEVPRQAVTKYLYQWPKVTEKVSLTITSLIFVLTN